MADKTLVWWIAAMSLFSRKVNRTFIGKKFRKRTETMPGMQKTEKQQRKQILIFEKASARVIRRFFIKCSLCLDTTR